jgi:glycosyltransferase involved in cell wall biosynthesis
LVKSVSRERVVIAGDPFFSFWTLWVMKKLFLNPASIQISIHGMPLGLLGHSGFNLRIFALKSASRKADSIRVVSNHLSNLLQADWGISTDKILIAPIPVQFSPGVDLKSRRREILIVGRLHEERGVSLAIEIALSVLSKDADACLVVIGDGPLKSTVESCVLQSRVGDRVSLLGRLPHSDVLERMGKSSVLLTAAPQEGFGLTIREAAYSGLSVVALRNLGTTEAEGELAQILSLFSSREEGVIACQQALDSQVSQEVVERVRNNAKALNEESLRKLSLSWI